METCDVLIVGGGPAGSTCAWKLRQAGLDVLVIDRREFPRDKICAGWITPQVVKSLELDVADYQSRGLVFQPITSFHTGLLGAPDVQVHFDQPVSYGIRRCEFDNYLLRRSGARLRLGEAVATVVRQEGTWIVNDSVKARMLVGAGGHFCPIARRLRPPEPEAPLVTAVEAEFPIDPAQHQVAAEGTAPRLYFTPELDGYGWCVRKGNFLNIGLGLVDSRETSRRVPELMDWIANEGAFVGEPAIRFHGHAYHLYDGARDTLVDDGLLLIGDAAGLAYPQSGEGIRPAVESGLLAARTISEAGGDYRHVRLAAYQSNIRRRLGTARAGGSGAWLNWLPQRIRQAIVRRSMSSRWFARNVIVFRWFLHAHQPPLTDVRPASN